MASPRDRDQDAAGGAPHKPNYKIIVCSPIPHTYVEFFLLGIRICDLEILKPSSFRGRYTCYQAHCKMKAKQSWVVSVSKWRSRKKGRWVERVLQGVKTTETEELMPDAFLSFFLGFARVRDENYLNGLPSALPVWAKVFRNLADPLLKFRWIMSTNE